MLTSKDKNIIKVYWNDKAREGDPVLSGDVNLDPSLVDYKVKSEQQILNRLIRFDGSMNVLELGCGGGRLTTYLSNRVGCVTAVDYSQEQIKLLKSRLKDMGINNIKVFCENVENLNFGKDYDVILLSHISMYMDDEELTSLLSKLPFWLKDGGKVISYDSLSASHLTKFASVDYIAIYRTRGDLYKLFNSVNFLCEKDTLSLVNLYNDFYILLKSKCNNHLPEFIYPMAKALIKVFPFLVLYLNTEVRGKKPGIYRLYSSWFSVRNNLKSSASFNQFFTHAKPLSVLCYIDNKFSAFFLYLTQRFCIYTPNVITVASLTLGLLAGITALLDLGFFVFAVLSVLTYTFDNADGMLARTRKLTSKLGGFLDWFFDLIKDYFIEVCFVYSYLMSKTKDSPFPALVFMAFVYFAIKAIAHLTADWKELESIQIENLSILRYTPAEKYILAYPLMYSLPAITPFIFSFHLLGYSAMIMKRFLKEVRA